MLIPILLNGRIPLSRITFNGRILRRLIMFVAGSVARALSTPSIDLTRLPNFLSLQTQ